MTQIWIEVGKATAVISAIVGLWFLATAHFATKDNILNLGDRILVNTEAIYDLRKLPSDHPDRLELKFHKKKIKEEQFKRAVN